MREIVFGLEDSFVSTLGAVTGIAAGADSTYIVIMSGLVIVAVEAVSMAAGSYLSNKSATEAEREVLREEGKVAATGAHTHLIRSAAVMGVFYVLGGFVPLAPYFFLPIRNAYAPSIILTAFCLFALGAWSASFSKRSPWRGGAQMAVISLSAAAIGFVIGRLVGAYYGVVPGM
ncbi:hypothetical protein A2348_01795 [Candidatus Uhrbacteria bacterium RIFOXYB12_FULL_58_10]|uniref:VIT family protein n=1 Tax=Candidatus Uhrbacteria bacterium RIFOXYB2_FULL_57_15 TaxID=1802422 RepID=A0A1F7W4W5_9BACT|nr:MAG: hypothetical protein A2348_01795 [Candidatus Uhrbacteria bacterium RIFOXYB12_FULL_58_10]OGL97852.1 MAG: hypothetical protein A2304_04700 [Candidatus Uhrbacteria bacterium RIFOXYB2_FULL_57_15]